MNGHLKIVGNSLCGHHTKIFWVDKEGKETDISRVFTGAKIDIHVDKANTVILTAMLSEFETVGIPELIDLVPFVEEREK